MLYHHHVCLASDCYTDYPTLTLLEELAQAHLLIVMLVEHLGRRQVEVFLRDVNPPFSKSIHASFGTDSLELSARASIHLLSDLGEVDTSGEVHASAVDSEDIGSCLDTILNQYMTCG